MTLSPFRVLGTEEGDAPDTGIVHFKHYGVNQEDKLVFEGERRVLVKKRGWGGK